MTMLWNDVMLGFWLIRQGEKIFEVLIREIPAQNVKHI
jgi:hypothetical protein